MQDLDDMNIEIMRNTLYKVYLEDFYRFCQVRGVMEKYPPYQSIFSKLAYGESQMLDKALYEEEVKRLCLAFEQQVLWKLLNCICVVSP
ncbi:hypothetical protein RND71_002042 [Anisodus tanguticus]|uniref:Uncharacterized protein n=1 Tax=Anisodus tanguticus TaxID=243964 RepID=A0AAE1T2C6_9SOLA|nr:hypothetical protein RND71_002042 [Anisodus tanguticus]